MITLRIGYIGAKKTGKSSIIKYIFENMNRMDTSNLPSTDSVETTVY
jgi:ribosome biogenesis GTPase A